MPGLGGERAQGQVLSGPGAEKGRREQLQGRRWREGHATNVPSPPCQPGLLPTPASVGPSAKPCLFCVCFPPYTRGKEDSSMEAFPASKLAESLLKVSGLGEKNPLHKNQKQTAKSRCFCPATPDSNLGAHSSSPGPALQQALGPGPRLRPGRGRQRCLVMAGGQQGPG